MAVHGAQLSSDVHGKASFFAYEHLRFRYEPYPIGVAKPLMDESTYQEFVEAYPSKELFTYLAKVGHK